MLKWKYYNSRCAKLLLITYVCVDVKYTLRRIATSIMNGFDPIV